uniref:RING finger protein 207 n=1 Tax=Oncorhynchus tshawytscha TaxID=74940 RepID=A0A8C8H1A0_ONCTS
MAGGVLSPLDNLCGVDCSNVHPLFCHLCHEQYQHPCLLDCYHIFCARCLQGRANESRLNCPLCGYPSVVKGMNALPPEDRLLKFLVDNSTDDCEETVQCANCDQQSNKQDTGPMYYCNTCSQPLCGACRDSTHKAKMFSHHEIVFLAKRTKVCHRMCSLHDEPYIMFSTEKKSMLCIKCFRDMQVESRIHCIDIETAYMQGCEILDQAVLAVKELQTSAREAIIMLRAMIGAVGSNMEEEENAICNIFTSMQVRTLFMTLQDSFQEKALKEQLSHLAALLPTLQVHLVTCSAFLSSANKFEFLDMGYQLMERLRRIVKLPHQLRPVQSSKINTGYRVEFARCLEPLLLLGQRRPASITGATSIAALGGGSKWMLRGLNAYGRVRKRHSQKSTSHRYICTKVLLAEGGDTPFTEHCRNYENSYRTLQTEIQNMKDQVQELHRDLTKHHSLINTDTMGEILDRSLHIDGQISSQYSSVETMRALFEEIWEETFQRVTNEQEIYEAQLHDLQQLKQENLYLTTIARQIGPYILSIAKVKERLEPSLYTTDNINNDRKLGQIPFYNHEGVECTIRAMYPLFVFLGSEDHTCPTDSDWEKNMDNRSLIIQSDEASIKTNDYHWPGRQTANYNEMPL